MRDGLVGLHRFLRLPDPCDFCGSLRDCETSNFAKVRSQLWSPGVRPRRAEQRIYEIKGDFSFPDWAREQSRRWSRKMIVIYLPTWGRRSWQPGDQQQHAAQTQEGWREVETRTRRQVTPLHSTLYTSGKGGRWHFKLPRKVTGGPAAAATTFLLLPIFPEKSWKRKVEKFFLQVSNIDIEVMVMVIL